MDSREMEAEMKKAFKEHGISGLKKSLEQKVDGWKNVPLRIGVTGSSGVGKSTFINTIREIDAESELAAATGSTETTMCVKEYIHPKNEQLILCDLPGAGTGNFPKDTYLTDKAIGFDSYDMFIILTRGRIYENDIWLAQAAKERGKAYLFIRTQIDTEVNNEKKTKPKKFKSNPNAENDMLNEIRSNLEHELRKGDVFTANRVFLIDCTDPTWHTYDFDLLVKSILTNFPALKREALVMSLAAKTPDLIREKVGGLRNRLRLLSCFSGIVGAVPVPGLSVAVDVDIVLTEISVYKRQLGLTDEDLQIVADECRVPVDILKRNAELKTSTLVWSATGIVKTFGTALVAMSIEETTKYIPIIGSIVAGVTSFWSTQYILGHLLDMFEKDALALDKYMRSCNASV